MKITKIVFGVLLAAGFMSSCNEAQKHVQAEADKIVSKTNESVQPAINDMGLVYVEEGAQTVITYDEVNAAQQAWCDALVKIGKLKEEGGDYISFANEVLSTAYNYDSGKVFFKPTLAYGDQTF